MDVRELARALIGAPASASPASVEERLRKNSTAKTHHSRMRRLMSAVGESDVFKLYDKRTADGGSYACMAWIDEGILPCGEKDEACSVGSDVTRHNMYATLLAVSRLPAVSSALSETSASAVSAYRGRLSSLKRAVVAKKPGGDGGGGDGGDGGGVSPAHTLEDIVRVYREKAATSLSPEDYLMVSWWLHDPGSFPPPTVEMGNVVMTRGKNVDKCADGEQAYLMINARSCPPRSVLIHRGEKTGVPDALTEITVNHMNAHGWRRWLFQSRTGKARPLKGSACAQQLTTAMHRLTGRAISASQLRQIYSEKNRDAPPSL
nr:hypothetical protein TetV2_00568 [Oceanusvirus sp.]